MATSGTMRPLSNGILVTWSLAEQSVSGNYSIINLSIGWSFQSSPTDRQLDNGTLTANGNLIWRVPGRVKNYTGSSGAHDYWAWSGQHAVFHDGSGNGSITLFGEMVGYSSFISNATQAWSLPQIPRLPNAPANLQVSGHQDSDPTTATFTWNIPTDVGAGLDDRRIIVARDSNVDGPYVYDSQTDWNQVANATGLPKGTQLYAKVQASSVSGWGPWSSILAFQTGYTVPNAPAAPTFSNIGGSTVTVNWAAPSDSGGQPVTGYDVQRATNTGFTSNVVTTNLAASPTLFNVTGLAHTTTYYYRVRATTGFGVGAWSTGASFTTLVTPPAGPATGPTLVSRTPVSVTISYTAPADNGGTAVTGYTIQWAQEPTFATPGSLTEATTSRTITALLPSSAYYVRVRANNSAGSGAWSSTLAVRTTSGLKVGGPSSWTEADVWVSSPDGTAWLPARLYTSDGSQWK